MTYGKRNDEKTDLQKKCCTSQFSSAKTASSEEEKAVKGAKYKEAKKKRAHDDHCS